LIWVGDIALPVFRSPSGSQNLIGALLFDEAVLRTGAEVSLSNVGADRFQVLPERLAYEGVNPGAQNELVLSEEGNAVVAIKESERVIGSQRQSLVQIQLRTNRPFPARDTPLQLQVGKKLFLEELAGDYTGRTLTLTLTPEMFAELKDGAAIMAFYGKPDGSALSGNDVWYFGRLNKSALQ
jgi:hypothetical protein